MANTPCGISTMKGSIKVAFLLIALGVCSSGQSRTEVQEALFHYQQAQQQFQEQNLEKARQEATLALRLVPRMAEAENLLGIIEDISAHPTEAESHFNRAL